MYRLLCVGAGVPRCACIIPQSDPREALRDILDYFSDPSAQKQYAVRSSASEEDGPTKSYAGQFESFLRVSGLENLAVAVEKCRESGRSQRVKQYSGKEEIPVAALVQEMVEADYAGVLFTCDPVSGSRNHVIVERIPGTAENLVGGTSTGEKFVLDRAGNIIDAPEGFHRDAQGGAILCELAGEAVRLEEKLEKAGLEGPLDFEWVVKDGEIFWLQVRPVTAYGRREKGPEEIFCLKPGEFPEVKPGENHWTSNNAQEAIPNALAPFSTELVLDLDRYSFKETFHMLGVPREKTEGIQVIGVFDGRAFLNLTGMRKLVEFMPLENPEVMVKQFLTGELCEKPRVKLGLSTLIILFRVLYKHLFLEGNFERFIRREYKEWKYTDPAALEKMTPDELYETFHRSANHTEGFSLHMLGGMRYMDVLASMGGLGRKYHFNPTVLIQGLGTLLFASSAAAMKDLAWHARDAGDKLFHRDFTLRDEWKSILEEDESLAGFREKFRTFLEEYGHLGSGSADMYCKVWRESPRQALQIVGNILKSGRVVSRDEYLAELREKRENAEKEIRQRMTFPDRLKFTLLLKLMRRSAPLRENMKFIMHRRMAIGKEYLLELGRRLVEKGVVLAPGDIFFFYRDELKDVVKKEKWDARADLVETRKKELKRFSSLPCPLHRVESPHGSRLYFAPPTQEAGQFHGIGGSSGRAAGRARVIRDISEANRLQPGEILVTKNTDPSWTPLFSIASAIVVEVGSMLSHGAVTAREAGIPAVLGIPGIMGAIRDGDNLMVDGDLGIVTPVRKETS